MKKYLFIFLLPLFVLMTGCSDDAMDSEEDMEMETDNCQGTAYTYNNNIKSIINSNCTLSGCHDGGGALPDFTNYQGVFARRGSIKARVVSMNMPPANSGRSLSASEIEMISCWVDTGAPE